MIRMFGKEIQQAFVVTTFIHEIVQKQQSSFGEQFW